MELVYGLKFKIGCVLSSVCQFRRFGVMHRFSPLWLYHVIISCHGPTCNFATTHIFPQVEDTVLSRPTKPKIQPLGPRQCRILQYGNAYRFLPLSVDNMVALFTKSTWLVLDHTMHQKPPYYRQRNTSKKSPSFSFASPRHANHAMLMQCSKSIVFTLFLMQ